MDTMKDLLVKTFKRWVERDPLTYSASVAYYAVFSMPGLLIIIIGLGAIFFEQHQIEDAVLRHIRDVLGRDAAQSIHDIVADTQQGNKNFWTMLVGIAVLTFGATGLFVQLQRTLNHIWNVEVKKNNGFLKLLKNRAAALGIMISIGFLLMLSMSITTLLMALGEWMAQYVPVYVIVVFHFLDFVISLGIISVLFALIFKVLPDIHMKWRYALAGGAVSSVLFAAGEYAMNYYFNVVSPQTTFGAAGSVILFMLWVSYSCLILLYGAQFARVMSGSHREEIKPTEVARKKLKSLI